MRPERITDTASTQACIDKLMTYVEAPRIRHARVIELISQEGWGFSIPELSTDHQKLYMQIRQNYMSGIAP